MFGRVRKQSSSSSSPHSLDRHSTLKLIKSDPLSMYESTLIKLKQGSRRKPVSIPDLPVETDNISAQGLTANDAIPMDSDSSAITHHSAGERLDGNKSKSILCFFSRRKDAGSYSSSCEVVMTDGDSSKSELIQSRELPLVRGSEGCRCELESAVSLTNCSM